MLTLKYVKQADACFISHIDLLRHTSRILRRADIPVKFSQGFNPHALVFFSPPLAVGVASEAEYLTIDTDITQEELLERYNASVPANLRAIKTYKCEKNPNLQGKIIAAEYVFDTHFCELDLTKGFEIEYMKKGKLIREDVSDKIFGVYSVDGKLGVRLAAGNTNLRPDRILPELNRRLGVEIAAADIKKTRQFVRRNESDELMDVDDYLTELSL